MVDVSTYVSMFLAISPVLVVMVMSSMTCLTALVRLYIQIFKGKLLIISFVIDFKDIDECSTNASLCHAMAECVDTEGSYSCQCSTGYTGDGLNSCTSKSNSYNIYLPQYVSLKCVRNTSNCTDINECDHNLDNCDMNADCTDTIGSFNCTCVFGYTGTGQLCGNFIVYYCCQTYWCTFFP